MILYFGNILSKTGNNPSFIELLVPQLQKDFEVKAASDKANKILRLLDMIFLLLKNRREAKVVLIDTYSYQGFYYAYVIALLCRVYQKPYIPIIRGGDFANRIRRSPKKAKRFLSNASNVVVPSEYMQAELNSAGFQTQYIPNFIDIEAYDFKPRKTLRPRLLWVRSFHKIYNPELALEVASVLREKFSDVRLCMVGPDKDGSLLTCEALANQMSLTDVVDFTGKLSKEKIREISFDYDIFINTTSIDNHPVSVIEAMSLGLVVISTNVGGIPYLIQHQINGLLVPPGSSEGFVKSIESLLGSRIDVQAMQRAAREKVERYAWSAIRPSWTKLLKPYYNS
jgi:glycosyltransferase involved in cell wall biosynthesis